MVHFQPFAIPTAKNSLVFLAELAAIVIESCRTDLRHEALPRACPVRGGLLSALRRALRNCERVLPIRLGRNATFRPPAVRQ
jgi:hypothetical protein